MSAALGLVVAIVLSGQTPLRAAAHDSAPRQAALAAGDWLEVRGEQKGYLQVYDHRRERPGYVRPAAVRTYPLTEATAPKLGVLVEYLRDAPGQESLGIGYTALYLRAAPANAIGADVFDALGTMADRLARRASARVATAGDSALAAEMEAAESYGVHFARFERDGHTRVCYDGEAFRRALALGATGTARVRAGLALTDPACLNPDMTATPALELVKWQSTVLDGIDPTTLEREVPAYERARLRMRRATVKALVAHYAARSADFTLAKEASAAAKKELLLVDRPALADDDRMTYEETALRVGSVRWGEDAAAPPSSTGLRVELSKGAPGQTCARVSNAKNEKLFEHCTYAVVWPSSVRIAPHDAAIALVATPLVGWNELLLLHPTSSGWVADTVTPATLDPDLGYVEPAGFSPDGARLLVAREARASGPLGSPNTLAPWIAKSFEVVRTSDMHVEANATSSSKVPMFQKWTSPDWHRGTLALR